MTEISRQGRAAPRTTRMTRAALSRHAGPGCAGRRRYLSTAPRGRVSVVIAALLSLCVVGSASRATAQPAADRSAMEAKAKAAAEKRKRIAEIKKERTKETSSQAEERERMEKKAENGRKALALAQAALKAASFRKNKKGFELMKQAWQLDSQNMDYSFNAAQFAAALHDNASEFVCYAGFMNVAQREEKNLGPGASQFKTTLLERMAKARARMVTLRKLLSVGRARLVVEPSNCELYFDEHMVGEGGGTIEAITGQHKVRTDCAGFYPLEQYVNVRVGDAKTAMLKPRPVAYFGYLVVTLKPADNVTIFLDDVPIADRLAKPESDPGRVTGTGTKIDPYRLHARKWIIRFKKDGYDRWHRRITIERDRINQVSAALERMADTVESSGND